MYDNPLVTVFIPYYNDEMFLKKTIQSVVEQTYDNLEIILFNHGSTDASYKIAHSFDDTRIIHIETQENLCAGSGVNSYNCWDKMHGKYIKLFCADDVMMPDCIEKMVNYLETNTDKDFVYSDSYFIDEHDKIQRMLWSKTKRHIGFNLDMNSNQILKLLFMRHSPLPFPAFMFKKEDIKTEFLDKSYIHLFDVNLWANLLVSGKKLGVIKEPLIAYRETGKQITNKWNDVGKLQMSSFEVLSAYDVYYNVKDYEQLKVLCPYSPYIDMIGPNDVWAFEFIIAHYYLATINNKDIHNDFVSYREVLQFNGYRKIHDMLEDDEIRCKLKEKFNFGIKEFRLIYSHKDKSTNYKPPLKSFRTFMSNTSLAEVIDKITSKQALDLSVVQAFLMFLIKLFKLDKLTRNRE